MIPAEKYMPKNNYRATDMNFVPFQSQNMPNNTKPTTFTGWIPVYFFNNNMPFNTIMTSLPFQSSANTMNLPQFQQKPQQQQQPTSNTSFNQFPEETTSDTLFSYNKQSGTTSTEMPTTQTSITAKKPRCPIDFDVDIINSLREFDLDLDEDIDLVRNDSDYRASDDTNIETIFKDIEKNYPGTFSLLQSYNVPYPIVKLMIRRVIKLTLICYNKKVGE